MTTRTIRLALICLLPAIAAGAWADDPDWSTLPYTTHSDFQAVDTGGFGTFPVFNGQPVKMRGVILNDPANMLNPTPGAPGFLGGLWQVFIQPDVVDDFGGTALWMGQYLGNITGDPNDTYSDVEWLAELDRLSHDPDTGHAFDRGDLVEIHARAPGLHFRGKTNINEQHSGNPLANFDVCLIEANHGLPAPRVFTLADVKDSADEFIFDPDRLTGAENYQGTLVRVNGVTFEDTENWGPDGEMVISDGAGRTMPVLLGRGHGFEVYDPPAEPFDLIAIFDQEDFDSDDGLTDGYRLWIMDYDGNGSVLNGEGCDGDIDGDGAVGLGDLAALLASYGTTADAMYAQGDLDRDGDVDLSDLSALLAVYGTSCW